jgi:hypothetical protein
VNGAALTGAARTVAELTRARFPDGRIPYHSRWRHFEAGHVNRAAQLDGLLVLVNPATRARAKIDLALVSVLLDAGAGPQWAYREAASGQSFARSEGLGVASFHAFTAGLFSSDPQRPLQVDAAGLKALSDERLGEAFQVSADNPLVGLEGRTQLLRRLGEALKAQPDTFGTQGRPGGLYDALLQGAGTHTNPVRTIAAHDIRGPVAGHAVHHLAGAEHHRRPGPRRLLVAPRRGGRGPHRRLDAVPQTLAVARLFAARTV